MESLNAYSPSNTYILAYVYSLYVLADIYLSSRTHLLLINSFSSITAPTLTARRLFSQATPASTTTTRELPTAVRPALSNFPHHLTFSLGAGTCTGNTGTNGWYERLTISAKSNAFINMVPFQVLPTPLAAYRRNGWIPEQSRKRGAHRMGLPVLPADRLRAWYAT